MYGHRVGWAWSHSRLRGLAVRYCSQELPWMDRVAWVIWWRVYLPVLWWIERNVGE